MQTSEQQSTEGRAPARLPVRPLAIALLAIPSSIVAGWILCKQGSLASEHVLSASDLGRAPLERTVALLDSSTTLTAIGVGLMVAVPLGCLLAFVSMAVRGNGTERHVEHHVRSHMGRFGR